MVTRREREGVSFGWKSGIKPPEIEENTWLILIPKAFSRRNDKSLSSLVGGFAGVEEEEAEGGGMETAAEEGGGANEGGKDPNAEDDAEVGAGASVASGLPG